MGVKKIIMKKILILLFLCGLTLQMSAQCFSEDIAATLLRQDALGLLLIYNKESENNRLQVEDAFITGIDISKYSYEQIETLCLMVNESSVLGDYLFKIRERKKNEIIKELEKCSAEEIVLYAIEHPTRKILVSDFINTVILSNLDSLSYKELSYIGSNLQDYDIDFSVENEKKSRTYEVQDILQQSVHEYCKEEFILLESLLFNIEKSVWKYLFDGYKEVANYYSQIGMIPDDVATAVKQYRALVETCIPTKSISEMLETEISQFCNSINEARVQYAQFVERRNPPKITFVTPDLDFTYDVPNDMLAKVGKAREDFVEDRETAKTISNVASFFIGFWATIGKGALDMIAVSNLSDKEITFREMYMQEVLKEIVAKTERQNQLIKNDIIEQFNQNQNEFINFITK